MVSQFEFFILTSVKASTDQQHAVGNLVSLLKYGGFFRDSSGLNSLQTFKRFAQIMNKPNGFQVDIIQESITDFIRNSGWFNWFTRKF